MERWRGRVALVTGASSGIGLSIAKKLVGFGLIVVGCARNVEKLVELRSLCTGSNHSGTLHPYKCDLTKDSEITEMFAWIENSFGTGVDICINNAGYTTGTPLLEISGAEMRQMLDTNVVGLALCSQLAFKSMLQRKVVNGDVININSVLGHQVMGVFNFYASTKHAVTALTQGFRKELVEKGGLRIRVTSISPGRTETNFLHTAYGAKEANRIYSTLENLQPKDVANSLLHILSSPPHVQIPQLFIEPVQPTPPGPYGSGNTTTKKK